ncbi:hypothetical protein CEXT_126371 [Caerostris extrusa]|uniref:Transmembrane protein n=1 Tax=Caerostris extrusa TaxID=172846 RepID=A0AAV4XEU3_CAEEX|nr:hypothetical protein CEXT_126371 [Caerostris extrusa]
MRMISPFGTETSVTPCLCDFCHWRWLFFCERMKMDVRDGVIFIFRGLPVSLAKSYRLLLLGCGSFEMYTVFLFVYVHGKNDIWGFYVVELIGIL